jgi:glycine/D-amino acid oxidase-like deaminating enzyme
MSTLGFDRLHDRPIAGRSPAIDWGKPFWWEEAPPLSEDAGPISGAADVVVIGAGFTGLSAALTLARAGRNVLVCEAGAIGEGASTRNGAHVAGKLRPSFSTLVANFGEARAMALCREGVAARAYIEHLIRDEGIECDFQPCDRFHGAHRTQDFAGLVRSAETMMSRVGVKMSIVPRSEQHRVVSSEAYHGGVIDHTTAAFHPAKYVAGLASRVVALGARLSSHNRVRALRKEAHGWHVETERGTVIAPDVILATNGYTGPEFPEFQRRIIPIGSYIIATEPMPTAKVDSLLPGCRLLVDTRRAASYLRASPDGTRIIYGGRVAAAEVSPSVSGPRLQAVLVHIFPQLRDVAITHSWMGFTGFTFDDLPHTGSKDGLHYAMGYCGTSGTSLGTYLGHKTALRILGNPEATSAFDGLTFQSRAFYRGNPWFLSTAVAVFRLRDKLHL